MVPIPLMPYNGYSNSAFVIMPKLNLRHNLEVYTPKFDFIHLLGPLLAPFCHFCLCEGISWLILISRVRTGNWNFTHVCHIVRPATKCLYTALPHDLLQYKTVHGVDVIGTRLLAIHRIFIRWILLGSKVVIIVTEFLLIHKLSFIQASS